MNATPADRAVDATRDAMGRVSRAELQRDIKDCRKIHLLVFTGLYPNAMQPRHGVFVEERLRKLVGTGRIAATVVAPVPWFPFSHQRFGQYSTFARVPWHERRYGIEISHPRYPVIPKLGMGVASAMMFRALRSVVTRLHAQGSPFDLIDAHYFYPDGVAAARLGAALALPVVITARGNDVTLIPRYRRPRRRIQWAAQRAAAVVTVSRALRDKLVDLGVAPEKLTVLRNGVDLDRFGPRDRAAVRTRFGVTGSVWLTVGHLIERKGVHIAIEALPNVPNVTLLIAGDGPQDHVLHSQVERLGLGARVRFLGAIGHDQLVDYYNAADALILASSREGMPNVALESLACGTPVIAAPFDGASEVLLGPEAGEVATDRSPEAIAAAWQRLCERAPTRAATRAVGERLGWGPVADAQCALYAQVLAAAARTTSREGNP